jgi:hypothetical protein
LNRNIIVASFIIFTLLSNKAFSSDDITGLVITEYQAYAEIKPKNYSLKLKAAMTNIVSQKIYNSFILSLMKLSISKFGADITDQKKLIKIGINPSKSAAIVFNDIFFRQSYYTIFAVNNKTKFIDFVKSKAAKSGRKNILISERLFGNNKITIFKSGNDILGCFSDVNGRTVFTEDIDLMEKIITSVKNGKTLKNKPISRTFLKTVKNSFMVIYLKPSVFSQSMNMALLLSGNAPKVNFNFQMLQAFDQYAAGITFNRRLIGFDIFSGIAENNAYAEMVRNVRAGSNYNVDIINYLPPSPYIFLNANTDFKSMLKLLSNMFPKFAKNLLSFYKELENLSGVNLESGLLNRLGTRAGLSVYSFDPTFLILKKSAISNMNWIAYVETKDPGGAHYFVGKIVRSLKKTYAKTKYSTTFIRGYRFYKVKSIVSFYVGIFNNYIIIGTKEKTISETIKNMLFRRKTGFKTSLRSKGFAKMLENENTLNFFLNLEKIFDNSILPPLAMSKGIILKSLKNLFFSSNFTKKTVHTIFRLYFK